MLIPSTAWVNKAALLSKGEVFRAYGSASRSYQFKRTKTGAADFQIQETQDC